MSISVPRMSMRVSTAERLAGFAVAALVVLLAWKLSLPVLFPGTARVGDAFPRMVPGDSASYVLLLDARTSSAGDAASAYLRRLAPAHRVATRTLDWSAASSRRSSEADRRIASLVRAYGYSGLPLLLTFDGDGHVVRISTPPGE